MKSKRFLSVICLISLLCLNTVGILAVTFFRTDRVSNSFNIGSVSCDVIETFDGNVKSDVHIKNTGDLPGYIRAFINVSWTSEDGTRVYSEKPVLDKDYFISVNTEDWFLGKDGYYYFKESVNVGDVTSILVYEAGVNNSSSIPEGFKFCVDILASLVQGNPTRSVEESWVAVDCVDGKLQPVE